MTDPLVTDLMASLDQGINLLNRLSARQYTIRHPNCFNNSIGAHIRHNLDHFTCFLLGHPVGRIDYDARIRDPLIETDPHHAAFRLAMTAQALADLPPTFLDQVYQVKMDTGTNFTETNGLAVSTGRREMQFLLSHTIHHYALIAIMGHALGVTMEPAFGVAPSTRHFQQTQQLTCAQ